MDLWMVLSVGTGSKRLNFDCSISVRSIAGALEVDDRVGNNLVAQNYSARPMHHGTV